MLLTGSLTVRNGSNNRVERLDILIAYIIIITNVGATQDNKRILSLYVILNLFS